MKTKTSLLLASLLATASLAFAGTDSSCGGCCSSALVKTTQVAAADQPAYPLDTCVVSGEKLGDMGKPIDYIHKEEGKPDRLVRFCCKMCIGKFKKDPAKYLKLIDDAAAAKTKGEHAGHTM